MQKQKHAARHSAKVGFGTDDPRHLIVTANVDNQANNQKQKQEKRKEDNCGVCVGSQASQFTVPPKYKQETY